MDYTARFSELHYPLAVEHADSQAAGTHLTSYVSLANYHRAVVVLDVGDMQSTATLDCKIRQATDTSGTGVKDVTDKAITQLTQAGGDGNQLLCIELQTEELDVDGGFDCITVSITIANANVEYSVIIYGIEPRYMPTATTNWEEIVT